MNDYISPPSNLPSGSVVWAYLRDSGGNNQEQSVLQQEKEIEAYCKRFGLALVQVFADVAKSGGSVIGREAFSDLIDMSDEPHNRPNGLLLWNFARFARDLDDSNYYKALLRKRGLVVHSLTDPIPDGPYARVVEAIIDISNEEKRRQTSRDVKRALSALLCDGFAPGGKPPRGYIAEHFERENPKRDGTFRIVSRWKPDPDLQELVKLAWRMRAEGRSYAEISEATHGRLYTSKNSWADFFSNKNYLGIGKFGSLEIPGHHPALVDAETWERVQALRREMRKPQADSLYHPRRLGSSSLLVGLAVCIHCGTGMLKDQAGNGWGCYICGQKRRHGWKTCQGRSVGARKADREILRAVQNRVLTPDCMAELLDATQRLLSDTSGLDLEIVKLGGDLDTIRLKIDNLLGAIETGSRSLADRLLAREVEQAQIENKLRELKEKRKAAQVKVTPEALGLVLEYWRNQIDVAEEAKDIHALRRILRSFVTKLELGYNVARIHYSFPISALNPGIGLPLGGGTHS